MSGFREPIDLLLNQVSLFEKKSIPAELTDFSASAIDINLETLKQEGLLEREGTKGGV